MQQLSRSFHGAFRDMGTHDISIFDHISRYVGISTFQITSNFNSEQILSCNPGGHPGGPRGQGRHRARGGRRGAGPDVRALGVHAAWAPRAAELQEANALFLS